MTDRKKHLGGLDILKILATIGIVFHHYQQDFNVRFDGYNFNNGAFYFGYLVELFFIISGFLMRYNDDKKNKNYTLKFTKKVMRIWPMAAISSVFVIGLGGCSKLLLGKWWEEISNSIWNWFISIFLVFQGNAFKEEYGLNNPLWYVCVLFICYLIYYFICYKCDKDKAQRICFLIMVLIGSGIIEYEINFPFATIQNGRGYTGFFIGVILCDIYKKVSRRNLIIGSLLYGGIPILLFVYAYNIVNANLRMLLLFVIYPTIVLWAVCLKPVSWLGNNRLVKLLGKSSFEVYIWHYPCILLIKIIVASLSIEIKHTYVTMAIFALVIEIVAIFIYKFVEIPLVSLIGMKAEKNLVTKYNSFEGE